MAVYAKKWGYYSRVKDLSGKVPPRESILSCTHCGRGNDLLRNAWRYCHFGNFPADDARDAVSRVRSGIFAEMLREATVVPAEQ